MKSNLIALATAACLVAILATSAWAQDKAPVVDGKLWLSSSAEVRKAFLVGAGNMIALESAYAKKKGTPPPVAGTMATKALDGLTLDQVSDRITAGTRSILNAATCR